MTLRERAPIRTAIDCFQKYRRKQIDLEGLSQGIGQACSLLENDIPQPIREALARADSEIESIRFTINTADQPQEVGKLWRELEEVLARNGAPPLAESAEE
jgi:cysteine sulfinate desulfinase/cysteine desulfurase-like protein